MIANDRKMSFMIANDQKMDRWVMSNKKTVPEKSLSTWNLMQSNCSTEDASSSAALIPTALHCPSQLSLNQLFEPSVLLKTLPKIYV